MPEQTLQEQYEAMKARTLKKDGTARAGVTPDQVEALEELRIQAEGQPVEPLESRAELVGESDLDLPDGFEAADDGLIVPDEARLECADIMHEIAVNVNGRAVTRRVPTR